MIKEIKQQWHVYVFICFASVQYIILKEIVPAHETNSTQSLLKLFDSSLLSPLKTLLVRGCRFRSSFVHWNWTELPGGVNMLMDKSSQSTDPTLYATLWYI